MERPYALETSPIHPWVDRLVAATTVGAAGAIVYALWQVVPDGRGHGTHEQLGMTPCGWPHHYGIPCPTCGVTTAASHLVHGQPLDAVATQPFGAALAVAGLATAVVALWSLVTRQSFVWRISLWPVPRYTLWGIGLLLLSWGYKVLVWNDGAPVAVAGG